MKLVNILKTELLYRGSVKNIKKIQDNDEALLFEFSDRYSIYDWGEMPNHLSGKGASLAYISRTLFNFLGNEQNWINWKAPSIANRDILAELKVNGVNHHLIDNNTSDTSSLMVKKVSIYPPIEKQVGEQTIYDYSVYQRPLTQTLIPLEVVFRLACVKGSSLLSRCKTQAQAISLGLNEVPTEGMIFARPLIEFSTKLETQDRYLSRNDAQKISGMNDSEFKRLIYLAEVLALRLRDFFLELEIELADGKFEFAFDQFNSNKQRDFMLVDSLGPDEFRLSWKGQRLSKEVLRQFYAQTPWAKEVKEVKKVCQARGQANWKEYCKLAPQKLTDEQCHFVEKIYLATANEISLLLENKKVFSSEKYLAELQTLQQVD